MKIALYEEGMKDEGGSDFELLLQFDIADGWHIYDPLSGDESATPTKIEITHLPPGLTAGLPRWPPALKVTTGDFSVNEHKGQFGVLIPIHGEEGKDKNAPPLQLASVRSIDIEVTFGACSEDSCLPPTTTRLGISLAPIRSPNTPEITALFAKARAALGPRPSAISPRPSAGEDLVQLALAFLAGLILNLMPCVLPVISIKVLSFVQQARENRGRILALTMAFVGGMMAVFVGFGVAVVVGRESFGISVGQSSLFAVPAFLIAMTLIIFTMGLSLLGVFELNVPGLVSKAASGKEQEGYPGAFFKGVLATLLGIPCTGPFMGSAVTFAAVQPAPMAIGIWTSMGLGMSLPYILLGLHPAWVRLIPKPGMWMVYFKQTMGFLLMATVVWLLWSLSLPRLFTGLLIVLLAVAVAAWLYGQLAQPHTTTRRRLVVNSLAVLVLAGGGWYGWWLSKPDTWIPWSPQTMQQYQDRLRLVDFTANWCWICQQNKTLVLDTPAITQALQQAGGVKLIADWTSHPPEITREMERIAKKGANVPLLAIYPAGAGANDQPLVLDSVLTIDQVETAIKQAEKARK